MPTPKIMQGPQENLKPQGQSPGTQQPQPPPAAKMFNCVVDDTALLAGVKKSTRDGIRKWVATGIIRLYVPLHTLTRLNYLQKSGRRNTAIAQEALQWLDDVTSHPQYQTEGRVQLEGGDELYSSWAEVERFMLPETLLSMDKDSHSTDGLADDFDVLNMDDGMDKASTSSKESNGRRSKTPSTPRSQYSSTTCSPGLAQLSPRKEGGPVAPVAPVDATRTGRPMHKKSDSKVSNGNRKSPSQSFVPKGVRPLFNHLLWRINHEQSPADSFILLTNDSLKQRIAQRFGIRAKRLEQFRDIVAREEKDQRNRMQVLKKEAEAQSEPQSVTSDEEEDESDDESEVVFKGKKALATQQENGKAEIIPDEPTKNVLDPNAFSRATPATPQGRPTQTTARPPRGPRGGHYGSIRGNPSRGGFAPRGFATASPRQPVVDLTKPIDPNSYDRPTSSRGPRGNHRRLWEPR